MQSVCWDGGSVHRLPHLGFKDAFRMKCLLTFWSITDEEVALKIQQSHARVLMVLVEAFREQTDEPLVTRGFLTAAEIGDRLDGFRNGRVITQEAVVDHIYGLRALLKPHAALIENEASRGYRIAPLGLRVEEIGDKFLKILEVSKVRGASKSTGNIVSFDVEPNMGMRIIPISKAKA